MYVVVDFGGGVGGMVGLIDVLYGCCVVLVGLVCWCIDGGGVVLWMGSGLIGVGGWFWYVIDLIVICW